MESENYDSQLPTYLKTCMIYIPKAILFSEDFKMKEMFQFWQ